MTLEEYEKLDPDDPKLGLNADTLGSGVADLVAHVDYDRQPADWFGISQKLVEADEEEAGA